MAIIFDENGLPTGRKVEGGHVRVLIVDDSQFVIKHLTQIFMSRDFEIAGTAENGKAGLELFKSMKGQIDLVTLDITMPEMDGIETLKAIRELDPNVTVVMITALGTVESVKEAIKLGAKGYIVKPIDREKVIERIGQILK
ncbi:MAG: response regulator [Brevinematia bacterium]